MGKGIFIFLLIAMISCTGEFERGNYVDENSALKSEIKRLERKLDSIQNIKQTSKNIKTFKNEDFDSFFWKFMSDSLFQQKRIKFPLEYISWQIVSNQGFADVGGKIDTLAITKNKWIYEPFYLYTATERTQIYDNFELKFEPTNKRLLHWHGVETGGDAKFYFEGFDGKWFLSKKVQLGD